MSFKNSARLYSFDVVFSEKASQLNVFEQTTKPLCKSVLNGFNSTVFCYGATGAGKTHTMIGSQHDPGIMFLTLRELFRLMESYSD